MKTKPSKKVTHQSGGVQQRRVVRPCFEESFMNVKCRCGFEADYMNFRSTVISGELPRGQMQCPECSRAWTVEHDRATILDSGFVMPGESRIKELAPTL